MIPAPDDFQAQQRVVMLTLAKLVGTILMLLGAGISLTGKVEPRDLIGGILFVVGAVTSLLLPRLLGRKWRTPPRP